MLTAGQVAPQAQLEESANDLGSAGSGRSQKTVHLGVSYGAGSENRAVRPPTCSKKGLTKKGQTNRQTQVFGPISSSAGTVFWTAKCQIPVAKPLKSGPQNKRRISLRRSTKEHLRLLLGRWHSPQVAPAAQK